MNREEEEGMRRRRRKRRRQVGQDVRGMRWKLVRKDALKQPG